MRAAKISVNVLRLLTFGGMALRADDGASAIRLRPQRLALLAIIAAGGDQGVSRERLVGLLWPESDEDRAHHSLRQTRYAIRSDLGQEVINSSGSTLSLEESAITADIIDFRTAVERGERERAISIARGSFLDGFYLPGAANFERWVEEERGRLTAAITSTLLSLAAEAAHAGDHDAVARWWGELTSRNPLSGTFALGYLKALRARGDRAAALAFARQHEAVVRRELEADPDPEFRRLEAELRAIPSPEVRRDGNGHGSGNGHGNGEVAEAPVLASPVAPTFIPGLAETLDPGPPVSALAPNAVSLVEPAPRIQGPRWRTLAFVAVAAVVVAGFLMQRGWRARDSATPTYAVGFIREDGIADSLGSSRVLTDMIATNLARVQGLNVLANSRLLELMQPGRDSAADYSRAARRAGATELLEGQLSARRHALLQLEVRRVDMRSGIVQAVYRVSAADRAGLVDSLTRVVARGFSLTSPTGSVSDVTTSSPTAYRLYLEGLRAFYQADMRGSQRLMYAALAEDSTFAMAWYYVDKIHWIVSDPRMPSDPLAARRKALEYASRLPERERLTISADLLAEDYDDRALAVAESLTTKYPNDPRGHGVLGKVHMVRGNWAGVVAATERAIALDSAAGDRASAACHLCDDFNQLADAYLWWDSLPAVVRTANRYRAAHPNGHQPFYYLATAAERAGDSTTAYAYFRRLALLGGTMSGYRVAVDLSFEKYDAVEASVRTALESGTPEERDDAVWNYLLLLRNEGRLRDAQLFNRTGTLPGLPASNPAHAPQIHTEGILALATGRSGEAARIFKRLRVYDMSRDPPGVQARSRAWSGTLEGMALAAGGDTAAVRALADSVERWGAGSAYGRDRKAHHYLRGLVLAAAGRHGDAVHEYTAAIHSPSLGFTRVNYELARSLLKLRRPIEAIATLQAALRGELYASCLYVTHSELHELLAQAFDAAGQSDSAAFHYRAVVRAWRRADPEFVPRREAARSWLARNQRTIAASP